MGGERGGSELVPNVSTAPFAMKKAIDEHFDSVRIFLTTRLGKVMLNQSP